MSIVYDDREKLFFLETAHSSYQMKVLEWGLLKHLYYGRKVGHVSMDYLGQRIDRGFSGNPYEQRLERSCSPDLIPQEYGCRGTGDYRVPALKTVLENGSRSMDLRYQRHEIRPGGLVPEGLPYVRDQETDSVQTLTVWLSDPAARLSVKLYYSVFEEKDVIVRAAELVNEGEKEITVEKAASASVDLPYGHWDLLHFHGKHCMERQMERVPLVRGVISAGSARGMSSHHQNPFVILADRETGENAGDCYGFMMVYSGNHNMEAEVDQTGSARIVAGIHEAGFSWRLGPGETFFTPEVILSFSGEGLNGLSWNYHRLIRENVCPARFRDVRRPVLINNWEATYFHFDTQKILRLAEQARDLGIEMLVLDDGWFGRRNDDNAGLGDWYVNEEKLPGGLKYLAEEIKKLGLEFGLWFEPEMVNEDSELYRNHPDWALKDPDRAPVMMRNQLVLDMSRQDVQDYLFDSMHAILESAPIDYVKWDFNRSVANVYSALLPKDRQGETPHRFILGTYALLGRITAAHPEVMIEGCAGGGGRFDAGMLFYCPQIWCSDNTDCIARLKIQKGTSYGYPVGTMGSHVSASPNHQTGRRTPLSARGITAMSGTFGYELDLERLTEEEKETVRAQIQEFHRYYWLIQKGRYYRLDRPETADYYTAWEFVSEDGMEALVSLVVTDVRANPEFPFIRLQGLREDVLYRAEGTNLLISGAALMYGGYTLPAQTGDYPAVQIHFTADAQDAAGRPAQSGQ